MSGFFFGRSLRSGHPLYLLLHCIAQKDAAPPPNATSCNTRCFIFKIYHNILIFIKLFLPEKNPTMRYLLVSFAFLFLLLSCKTTPINQKVAKKREGLWIENYSIDSAHYKSVGKYYHGDPVKKWKYYLNGKIIKKENYKQQACKITTYYENGEIQSKGQTKTTSDTIETHWFYDGEWKFYNENGKLIGLKKYKEGELLLDTVIKN